MKEEVFQVHNYAVGHRVDKQLLLALEDIFKQYSSTYLLDLDMECSNSTIYKFESIDECFDYFDKNPHRIVKMELKVSFGERYLSNSIKLTFNNMERAYTDVTFRFDNTDEYLILKNKIELCIKNFRLNYRILSIIPIIPIILTMIFVGICEYTDIKNIILPKNVQHLIIWGWLGGSFLTCIFPPFVRVKRNLFPCTEFRIGQNELVEDKNAIKRNFIVCTLVIGTILGIIVNGISSFLF